ncbi:unnamed protein product [Choristocarpus tenellus]
MTLLDKLRKRRIDSSTDAMLSVQSVDVETAETGDSNGSVVDREVEGHARLGVSPTLLLLSRGSRGYSKGLETNPVLVMSISSGLIAILADVLAQGLEHVLGRQADGIWGNKELLLRTGAVMINGIFINGPIHRHASTWLDMCIPGHEWLHALAEAVVVDPLVALAFFISTGLLERRSWQGDILPAVEDVYPLVAIAAVAVGTIWTPLQALILSSNTTNSASSWHVAAFEADLVVFVWTLAVTFFTHS